MPSAAAPQRRFAPLLTRLVFGVRERVLDRPAARAALRVVGWPAIKLMHRIWGRSPGGRLEGRHEGPGLPRFAEPVLQLPLAYTPAPPLKPPTIAVVLHAFYVDVLPDIVRELEKIPFPADVFVSTDEEAKRAPIAEAFAGWSGGRVDIRVAPNRGRNFGPQFVTFRDVYDSHELVLLLHSKKSTHTDELAGWREFLLDSLIGSAAQVRGIVEAFTRLPKLGVIAPRTFPVVRPHMIWSVNYPICRQLAERMGFPLYPDSPLDFPAGGMFWARSAALRPLLDLGLTWDDFPAEGGHKDGTLAHALERMIFHACELAGMRWIHAGPDHGAGPPETMIRVRAPWALEPFVTEYSRTLVVPGRRPHPSRAPQSGAPPPESARKPTFRRLCAEDLDAFLSGGDRLVLPTSDTPEVSIVLVLFNQAELTYQCLRSLTFALDRPSEVIIWDNGSSDRTGELLDRTDGARIVRSAENLHFLRGVNAAADEAHGRYLLLLNNDARVTPGSIGAAAARLDAEPDLGAVGGRIELLDGTLQEAGSIIWRDGACLGYGRGEDPWASEFAFRRDVDYCSGAFLMVRRELFERLGRFDTAFAPAYYEETDLCMRIREAGARVAYEPGVHLQHFEFASSSSTEAALALQAEHQALFVDRHAQALAEGHLASDAPLLEARMRGAHRGRLLIIEDRIPYPQLGAGYPRAGDILRAAHAAGWFVTLYPLVYPEADFSAAYGVIPPDVEIAAELGREWLAHFMVQRGGYYDAVIVSRPHNMQDFRRALAQVPQFIAPERIVYDAEAIFALREQHRRGLRDNDPAIQKEVREELALAKGAGAVLAVNALEAENFRAGGFADVRVVGHALRAAPLGGGFEGRKDLLFVGALDDDESPNVDSVIFLAQEVMPRLDALIGADYVLRVAGRSGARRIRGLASDRVQILGRVEDLSALYARSRLFVAPTRFAAGIPMKVHEAAAAGLPAAVTSLLARQLGWADGEEIVVGDSAEAFAAACARAYGDAQLWARLREKALARVAAECDPAVFEATVADALAAVSGR